MLALAISGARFSPSSPRISMAATDQATIVVTLVETSARVLERCGLRPASASSLRSRASRRISRRRAPRDRT